jgi:pimeloyl-ACP methyl ester carboxylesterase
MTLSISTKGGAVRMPKPIITQTARGAIEHTDEGDGSALLALHGGMGGVDQSWILSRALLGEAQGWRRVAVSRPGYLGTPLAMGRTPEEQADAYAALLDGLRVERAVVAAVSAGGPSAISFALRYPERCRGLILVSTPTGAMPADPRMMERLGKMERIARVPGLERVMGWLGTRSSKAGLRSVRDPELLARTMRDAEAGPLMRALQGSVFDRLGGRIEGTRNDTVQLAEMASLPLGRLDLPVLAVHGTADRAVSFEQAERLQREVPEARLLRIEGGEHVALLTHLSQVRAAAREFLRAL